MSEENNHNKIIETLADMNEAIGARFDRVDGRFDRMDQRLDRVDQNLTHILERLNRIEDIILQEHARRLEMLEQKAGTGK